MNENCKWSRCWIMHLLSGVWSPLLWQCWRKIQKLRWWDYYYLWMEPFSTVPGFCSGSEIIVSSVPATQTLHAPSAGVMIKLSKQFGVGQWFCLARRQVLISEMCWNVRCMYSQGCGAKSTRKNHQRWGM